MFKQTIWIGLAASVLGFVVASTVRADEYDKFAIAFGLMTLGKPASVPVR